MSIHKIQIEQGNIFCDRMKVGFVVKDSQDGVFVNLMGVTCKQFKTSHKATRWVRRNLEKFLPDIRSWLIERARRFPERRFAL